MILENANTRLWLLRQCSGLLLLSFLPATPSPAKPAVQLHPQSIPTYQPYGARAHAESMAMKGKNPIMNINKLKDSLPRNSYGVGVDEWLAFLT